MNNNLKEALGFAAAATWLLLCAAVVIGLGNFAGETMWQLSNNAVLSVFAALLAGVPISFFFISLGFNYIMNWMVE